jgi:hypothetical protein
MCMTRTMITLAGVLLVAGAASTAEAAKRVSKSQQELNATAAPMRMHRLNVKKNQQLESGKLNGGAPSGAPIYRDPTCLGKPGDCGIGR